MRILLAIVSLGLTGCADGCGPPGYALGGVCDSRVQVGTTVAVTPYVLTDIEETAPPPTFVSVTGLDMQPSDFVSVTSVPQVTITANRVDTGYVRFQFKKQDATFVIQVIPDAPRTYDTCETYAISVTDR